MSSAWAIIEDRGEILLVRRAMSVGRGGQWCPPGGTMWKNEWPEVAAVRETFEETRLRVAVRAVLANFAGSHYVLCRLLSDRDDLELRPAECIDARWIQPQKLLELGTIMDLRRIVPALEFAELVPPKLPEGLSPAVPGIL